MTGGRELAAFKRWTLAVLDLLGASPDRQAVYLNEQGVGADELLLQFDDVLHVARAKRSDGSLSQYDYNLILTVSEKVDAVNAGPDSIWTAVALGEAVEWRELRIAASVAKGNLEDSWIGNLDSS